MERSSKLLQSKVRNENVPHETIGGGGVRKSISKKIRFEIFKRDGFQCAYCGNVPPHVVLEIDHINPVSKGGDNDPDNLISSCGTCNRGKGATPLTAAPQSLAEKAKQIVESEAQLRGYYEIIQAKKDRIESEVWEVLDTLNPGSSEEGVHKKQFQSAKLFVGRLGFHETLEAAEIAAANGPRANYARFQYFCGVSWNKIKERENGQL